MTGQIRPSVRALPPAVWWAVGVGLVLRGAWAVAAARTPAVPATDAAIYLRMADQLAHLHTPTFGGEPSAFYAIGYPLLIAPFVALGSATGWFGGAAAAAVVNVVLGAATIVAVGLLAGRVFGRRAGATAAWLAAVAPAQVLFTATATTEVAFTFLVVTTVAVLVLAVPRFADEPDVRRTLLGAGVLAGLAVATRSHGMVLLAVPMVAGMWAGTGWRTAARATGAVAIGASLVLVPLVLRNGLQVGYWSPVNSSNAVGLCMGNHDGATVTYTADPDDRSNITTPEMLRRCLLGSPWTGDPAVRVDELTPTERSLLGGERLPEAEWYRRTTRSTVSWMVAHPGWELEAIPWRAFGALGTDRDALFISLNAEGSRLPSPAATRAVGLLCDTWASSVLVLAAVGLLRRGAARRASVIWVVSLLLLVPAIVSLGLSHYDFPAQPFLAVLAAGALSVLGVGRVGGAPATRVEVIVAPEDATLVAARGR